MKFDSELFKKIEESKAPIKLLIVPAQLTLSAETAAFNATKKEGFFDLQIMSGAKLRAEIISKTGTAARTPITTLGRSMILRKCAKEADLSAYDGLRNSSDFISSVGDFIVQAKQNKNENIEINENLPHILQMKLKDMAALLNGYESYMSGRFIDSEDGLEFATNQVSKCDFIKESEIWYVGFYSFTKREKNFLKALDENSYGCHVILSNPKEEFPNTIQPVIAADNSYEEALKIAAEILRLIREENYKAEDIMILSADASKDAKNYKRIFESLGIPTYIDEKRSIMHIDAASKIVNLLDMAADGLMAHSVIQFVGDDDFSNYVKNYHIKKNEFLNSFKYGGEKKIEAEIKRDEFANLTAPFFASFADAKTVKEKSTALYSFLVGPMNMPKALEERAIELAGLGYTENSEELAQAWSVICEILDQTVELLGDETLTNAEYRDIIKDAFKDVKIGLLPQKTGCIQVGDLYRSKAYGIKALFITSFNDERVPRKINASGILSDDEIEKLSSAGVTLCKSYDQLSKEDKLMIYEAFEAPSEKLYLSYATSDADEIERKPSYLITGLPLHTEDAKLYTLEELVEKLRNYKSDGVELDDTWKTVANKLSDSKRYQAAAKGLLYKNVKDGLSKDVAAKVLKPESISPSALENYVLCPYRFFIGNGLRAEDPEEFVIKNKDVGTIYHEVLNRLSQHLSSDGKSARDPQSLWQTITDSEIASYVSKTVDEIKEEDVTGLYTRSFAEEYRIEKTKELALRFASNMVRQMRLGNVDLIKTENAFEFDFHGTKIHGKIDRLDTTNLSDKDLVKIIDYKSGAKDFNKEKIEKGLDLQLMIYLEYATQGGAKPVGSFYFHIENPVAESDIISLELGELSEKLAETIADSYRLDGAFVAEPEAFMTLDKTVSLDEKSSVVKKSKAMTEAEYETLRNAFRENLAGTISKLQSGDVSIEPIRYGKKNLSCEYCKYSAICKFDPQVEGYTQRRM